jgi:hypothetical protein
MRKVLNDFEDYIKEYSAKFFDKVWEKHDDTYKLIYNIQGLVIDNIYYPNLKFIFWLDENKNHIVENVITYLYGQDCDYKSIVFNEFDIAQTITTILQFIDSEKSTNDLRYLLFDSLDDFNKIITQKDIKDFVQNIEFIPHGNVSCTLTIFKHIVTMNSDDYEFLLKSNDNGWIFIYNSNEQLINIKQVPEKLIEAIYDEI